MVESSVLFPVASVSSLEENGTSVVHCDYYLIRQPKPNHRNLKELVLTVVDEMCFFLYAAQRQTSGF